MLTSYRKVEVGFGYRILKKALNNSSSDNRKPKHDCKPTKIVCGGAPENHSFIGYQIFTHTTHLVKIENLQNKMPEKKFSFLIGISQLV